MTELLETISTKRKELQAKLSILPEFCEYMGLLSLGQSLTTPAPSKPYRPTADASVKAKIQEIFATVVKEFRDAGKYTMTSYDVTTRIRHELPDLDSSKINLTNYIGAAFLARLRVHREPGAKTFKLEK